MFCTCSKNFTRQYIYFVKNYWTFRTNIFNVHARFNQTSLGGYNLDSTFECYILKDCHWIFQTSWNEKRRFATLTSLLNHTSVIIGGEKDSTKSFDTIISLNDKSWNKVADLPVPVSRHCSVLIKEDTIYVIGGHIGKSTFSVETLTFNFLKSNFTTIGATVLWTEEDNFTAVQCWMQITSLWLGDGMQGEFWICWNSWCQNIKEMDWERKFAPSNWNQLCPTCTKSIRSVHAEQCLRTFKWNIIHWSGAHNLWYMYHWYYTISVTRKHFSKNFHNSIIFILSQRETYKVKLLFITWYPKHFMFYDKKRQWHRLNFLN